MNRLTNILFSSLCVLCSGFAAGCSGGDTSDPGSPVPPPDDYTGKVETYRYAPSVMPSTFYQVTVQGESQFVYPTPEPHLTLFGCDGAVKVQIRALRETIRTVAVRPVSKEYEYTLADNQLTLRMDPRDRVVVEINGDESNPLFLFANPIDDQKPDPNDPNVIYFGAGTVTTRSSVALQSGQHLYIEGGAVVNGAVSIRDASGVTISGGGILNCNLAESRAIFAYRSSDITMRDLTVINTDSWTTFMAECSDIAVSNYKVVATASNNEWGNENDALDLLGCRNATIEHCFGYCHDDVFCIKSQKWGYAGEASDIRFEDCIAWNVGSGNSFEIGYELNQPVRDISYRNIYSIHSAGRDPELRRGAIGIHNGAGGKVSGIRYENVFIEDPKEYAVYLRILSSSYDIGTGVEWTPGEIEDVTFSNVHVLKQAPKGSVIQGYDTGHTVKQVTFDGLFIDGVRVSTAAGAKIQFTHSNPIFQ